MNSIKITVSGQVASGKTRIAYLIRNTLQAAGFTVSYEDNENKPGSIDASLDEALANLSQRASVHIGVAGQTDGADIKVELDKESTTLCYTIARALVARGFSQVRVSDSGSGTWTTTTGVPANIAKTLSARLARVARTSHITIVEQQLPRVSEAA